MTRYGRAAAVVLLIGATALVYRPLLGGDFEFLSWDDEANVLDDPRVHGLSSENVQGAWRGQTLGVFEPFGVLLKAATVEVSGLNVRAFHALTLALHALNACLVFALARRLVAAYATGHHVALRPDAAGFVAGLLFALHPLRVEVVAWVSGQSYALAGTFFLVSLISYLAYVERRHGGRPGARMLFALSFSTYVAAGLSKSAAVFLPALLLVLDGCPLRRQFGAALFREKTPYALAALLLAIHALQATAGAQMNNRFDLDAVARVTYAVQAPFFYLAQASWPTDLLPVYPIDRPDVTPFGPRELVPTLAFASLCGLGWWARRRAPWLSASILAMLIGLLPVCGLVAHGGWVRGADRYTYLPLLPPTIVLGAVVTSRWLVPRPSVGDVRTRIVALVLAIVLVALGVSTARQVLLWRSTEALWTATIERSPANLVALNNLGFHYLRSDRPAQAIGPLRTALGIEPSHYRARLNLGVALERIGQPLAALRVYREGLDHYPGSGALHHNLSTVYGLLGRPDAALRHGRRARELGFRADPG